MVPDARVSLLGSDQRRSRLWTQRRQGPHPSPGAQLRVWKGSRLSQHQASLKEGPVLLGDCVRVKQMSPFPFLKFFSLRCDGSITQEQKKSVNGHHSRYWRDREGRGKAAFRSPQARAPILVLSLSACVIFGESLVLRKARFSHL